MTDDAVYRKWDDGFIIRRMRYEDAHQVISWFSKIASMTDDLTAALNVRQETGALHGFYIGELNGKVVASKIEIEVGEGVSCGNLLYVDEEYRSSGFARRMNDLARDMTATYFPRNVVSIDAIAYLESTNIRRGYTTAFRTALFSCTVKTSMFTQEHVNNCVVKQISDSDALSDILDYDDQCFVVRGSDWKRRFLRQLVATPGGRTMAAVSDGQIVGFVCRRPAVSHPQCHTIGPLYANSVDIALQLVREVSRDVVGHKVKFFISEQSEVAVRLMQLLEAQKDIDLVRMCRNGVIKQLDPRVFSMTGIDVCGY